MLEADPYLETSLEYPTFLATVADLRAHVAIVRQRVDQAEASGDGDELPAAAGRWALRNSLR